MNKTLKIILGVVGGMMAGGLGGAATGISVPQLGLTWGTVIGVVSGGLTGAASTM